MKFNFFSIRQKFNYNNVNFGVDPPPLFGKSSHFDGFFLEGFPKNKTKLINPVANKYQPSPHQGVKISHTIVEGFREVVDPLMKQ